MGLPGKREEPIRAGIIAMDFIDKVFSKRINFTLFKN
jgi:hypothetical protein